MKHARHYTIPVAHFVRIASIARAVDVARGISRAAAIAALLLPLALTGCGDDSPTAVNARKTPRTDVTVSESQIYWGAVCSGQTLKKTFTISADSNNTEDVSGEVAFDPDDTHAWFTFTAGAGQYTLAPGQEHLVEVQFAPTAAGVSEGATVETGITDLIVECGGFGSAYPRFRYTPTSLANGSVTMNYEPFNNAISLLLRDVSYSNPSWHSCNSAAWVFDGNPFTETGAEFTLDVPPGTRTVLINIGMDASSTCAQLLMEIDGSENIRSNFGTPCTTRNYRFNISPGRRTIKIGTDVQGVTCYSDISLEHITFTFEGKCVEPGDWL